MVDVPGVLARVPEYGGTVLTDTDLGIAVCIRDPDGQLIEPSGQMTPGTRTPARTHASNSPLTRRDGSTARASPQMRQDKRISQS